MARFCFLFFVFFAIVATTTAAAEDDGPQVERRGDVEIMIDRKYDLPRCLSGIKLTLFFLLTLTKALPH
jgi:hypothetical protein